jgi:hypothetical protein
MIIPTPATDLPAQPHTRPTTRTRRTQAQWKALLEEFNRSGLTKAAFSKKHRIATSSLYRWQQVFAEPTGAADFIDVTQPLSDAPAPSPKPAHVNDWHVELELGGGIVLRLRTR